MQWRGSVSQTDTYAALAIGSDSTRASCNTTGTNCTIPSLRCGLTYSIVVITSSVNCGSIEGSDYSLQSGNCVSFAFSTWVHEARSICECPLGGDIVPKYTNTRTVLVPVPPFFLSPLQARNSPGEPGVQNQYSLGDLGKCRTRSDPGGVSGDQQGRDHHLQLKQL